MLIARGDRIVLHRSYGTIDPKGGVPHQAGQRWRLASVTKQVTAVAVMRMVARGDLSLDASVTALGGLTPRMLLTHHTGLANPDSTATGTDGVPAFYKAPRPDLVYCRSTPAKPGAPFSYNNCDYLLAATLLESAEGEEGELDNAFWPGEFASVGALKTTTPGFIDGKPEPPFELSAWGAGGGLIGTAADVLRFDRALMTGKLLPAAARDELWRPEGNGSYQALGAWVFPGQLKGCAAPKRIVQRDGEIYGVQVRNFILPDDDLVVIVFTNRSADDFQFGQVWQRSGFAYDLLSAAVAC